MTCSVYWQNRDLNLSPASKPRTLGGGGKGRKVSAPDQDQDSLNDL